MTSSQSRPLVSVVMIFHDALPYFEEAIRSVVDQTFPCELLLCDDGSSDGSTAVARDWSARDPERIRYLEHPGHENRGMSATRNLGIAAAQGEFVAFLDADDLWEPQHLADDVDLLERHPEAGMVCGQALVWHSWRPDAPPADSWTPLPWPPNTVVPAPRMLSAILWRGSYCTPTCNLLVRRDVLRQVAGAEEQFTALFEDQALLAKLHVTAAAVISGSRTARYRQHEASATARAARVGTYAPARPNASQEAFLRWLEGFVESSPLAKGDEELREALRKPLREYEAAGDLWRTKARLRLKGVLPMGAMDVARRVDRKVRGRWFRRLAFPRRLSPVSRIFGYDLGTPVDRYYIERFLEEHTHLVTGRVLEVGDSDYSRRYGGSKVSQFDVLNVHPGHPDTTFVDDLADGRSLPSESFDCVILTQTLHLVFDTPAAVRTLYRVLRPGGTVLVTTPGISPIDSGEWNSSWYWSLTPHSARRLFAEVFGDEHVEVWSRGNLVTCTAFLQGMPLEELSARERGADDPQFPLIVTVKAVRPGGTDG